MKLFEAYKIISEQKVLENTMNHVIDDLKRPIVNTLTNTPGVIADFSPFKKTHYQYSWFNPYARENLEKDLKKYSSGGSDSTSKLFNVLDNIGSLEPKRDAAANIGKAAVVGAGVGAIGLALHRIYDNYKLKHISCNQVEDENRKARCIQIQKIDFIKRLEKLKNNCKTLECLEQVQAKIDSMMTLKDVLENTSLLEFWGKKKPTPTPSNKTNQYSSIQDMQNKMNASEKCRGEARSTACKKIDREITKLSNILFSGDKSKVISKEMKDTLFPKYNDLIKVQLPKCIDAYCQGKLNGEYINSNDLDQLQVFAAMYKKR